MSKPSPSQRFRRLGASRLLAVWAEVSEELRRRGITNSANNPVADYAERLVAEAAGGTVQPPSTRGFDVKTPDGERIQVKARRRSLHSTPHHFSAIRDIERHGFDILVAVVFRPDFTIEKAWRLPWAAVRRHAVFVRRTNSWRLSLPTGRMLQDPEVVQIRLTRGAGLPRVKVSREA
jgi:hypothetical protein